MLFRRSIVQATRARPSRAMNARRAPTVARARLVAQPRRTFYSMDKLYSSAKARVLNQMLDKAAGSGDKAAAIVAAVRDAGDVKKAVPKAIDQLLKMDDWDSSAREALERMRGSLEIEAAHEALVKKIDAVLPNIDGADPAALTSICEDIMRIGSDKRLTPQQRRQFMSNFGAVVAEHKLDLYELVNEVIEDAEKEAASSKDPKAQQELEELVQQRNEMFQVVDLTAPDADPLLQVSAIEDQLKASNVTEAERAELRKELASLSSTASKRGIEVTPEAEVPFKTAKHALSNDTGATIFRAMEDVAQDPIYDDLWAAMEGRETLSLKQWAEHPSGIGMTMEEIARRDAERQLTDLPYSALPSSERPSVDDLTKEILAEASN